MVFQNNIIKVPNLKFDIEKLKQAFNQVLKIKEFDNANLIKLTNRWVS